MDRIVYIGGKPYLLNAQPFVPALPQIDEAPRHYRVSDLSFAYPPPITEAAIVKEDRTDDLLDLGRLIANGAELDARRRDAEHRAGN